MARLSLFAALCSFLKKAFALIFSAAMLLCACGDQQNGILSIASEDVPFIYALGLRNTQAYLIVANGEGYYREYAITGYTTPTVSAVMSVGQSGRVYIGDTNTIYTSTSSDYSSWSSQAMAFGVLDLASTPFGDYLLQSSSADPLYRYEKSSNSWVSMGKTIPANPEKCITHAPIPSST